MQVSPSHDRLMCGESLSGTWFINWQARTATPNITLHALRWNIFEQVEPQLRRFVCQAEFVQVNVPSKLVRASQTAAYLKVTGQLTLKDGVAEIDAIDV